MGDSRCRNDGCECMEEGNHDVSTGFFEREYKLEIFDFLAPL